MLLIPARNRSAHADARPIAEQQVAPSAGIPDLPALIADLASDDDGAWDAFLARAGGFMRHIALQAVDDAVLADDAVQEALLTIRDLMGRNPPAFINAAAAGGWLRALTRNHARRLTRMEAARRRRHQRASVGDMATTADESATGIEPAAIERLRLALTALPDGQREALLLCFRDGMGNAAIAARLGCSIDLVAVNIHRGLHRLRQRCAPAASALTLFALMREASADAAVAIPAAGIASAGIRATWSGLSLAWRSWIAGALGATAALVIGVWWSLGAQAGPMPGHPSAGLTSGRAPPAQDPPGSGVDPVPTIAPSPFLAPYDQVYARRGSAFDDLRLEPAGGIEAISQAQIIPVNGGFVEGSNRDRWMLQQHGAAYPVFELDHPGLLRHVADGGAVEVTITASIRGAGDGSTLIRIQPVLEEDLLPTRAPHLVRKTDDVRLSNPFDWTMTVLPVGRTAAGHPIVEMRVGSAGAVAHRLGVYDRVCFEVRTGRAHLSLRRITWRPMRVVTDSESGDDRVRQTAR